MSAGAVKEGRHICRAFHKTKKNKKTMGVKCEPDFGFFFFFLHKECVKAWLWASDNRLT